jgi:hypothetical protein
MNVNTNEVRKTEYALRKYAYSTGLYLYVSVWNLQALNRVWLTLWDVPLMHVSSKSSKLIGKVFEGGIWEFRYTKSMHTHSVLLQIHENRFDLDDIKVPYPWTKYAEKHVGPVKNRRFCHCIYHFPQVTIC